jgi:thioredoxin-related protein
MRNFLLLIFSMYFTNCDSPEKLVVFDNFEAALAHAKYRQVKMLVIFDWHGAPTDFVEKLLENNEVKRSLKGYIVVRLMCDDRRTGQNGARIGRINSELQIQKTGVNSQPLFCFFDCEGNLIGEPKGYSPKKEIVEFLKNQPTHLCQ